MRNNNLSCRGIVFHKNQILLMRRFRAGHNYWVLPGGGVEDSETLEECVRREVKEETNIDVEVGRKFYTFQAPNSYKVTHYFFCKYIAGEVELIGEEKERSTENDLYEPKWMPANIMFSTEHVYSGKIKSLLRKYLTDYYAKRNAKLKKFRSGKVQTTKTGENNKGK